MKKLKFVLHVEKGFRDFQKGERELELPIL